jgi:hypothetical protein
MINYIICFIGVISGAIINCIGYFGAHEAVYGVSAKQWKQIQVSGCLVIAVTIIGLLWVTL